MNNYNIRKYGFALQYMLLDGKLFNSAENLTEYRGSNV
jgi:hypothetical protein